MKKNLKKGFTIVELVIVIAVIAVLAAVLIPTYKDLVQKANLSVDKQAVTNMNKMAVIGTADGKYENPSDVLDALYANGFNAGKMQAYTADHTYAYSFENNKMYLLDGEANVIYPEETVDKSTLWGFYYDSVEGKVDGITKYIAMKNVTNKANFEQAFGDGAQYEIDLNSYYIALGDGGSDAVTVKNGGFVSGNVQHDEVVTYTKATTVEHGKTYSYVVFESVKYQGGLKNSTFDNCIFYDSSIRFEGSLTMSNCTFIGGIDGLGAIELYANNKTSAEEGVYKISITNCEFNNVARGINISAGTARENNKRDIEISGCKFNGTTQEKYVIQIATTYATIAVKDCAFNSLGAAVGAVRLHDSLFNGGTYVDAFETEDDLNAFAEKITFSGNKFAESIEVGKYIETDGIETDLAVALDEIMTNKIK